MPGSRVVAAVPAEPPATADHCPCPGLGMAAESGAHAGRGRAAAPVAGSSPRRASGGRPWQLADSQGTPRVSASGSSWAGDPGTVQSPQLRQAEEEQIGFVHCLTRVSRISSLLRCPLGSSCRPQQKNQTAQGFAGFRAVLRSLAISYTKRRDYHAPCLSLAGLIPFGRVVHQSEKASTPPLTRAPPFWASKGGPGCRRLGGAGWLTFSGAWSGLRGTG